MKKDEVNEVGKQVGEQLVKKKKRPDLSAKFSVHTNPGDNTKYINHSLRLADLPKVKMTDAVGVRKRIGEYFKICSEDDMKPSVAGLALALDTDRKYLWAIREGLKIKTPEVGDLLKKAMKLLDLQMTDYMQNGKINPVSGIFLMKNNFGYADKQEVIVTPSPLGEAKDQKAIEEAYIEGSIAEE